MKTAIALGAGFLLLAAHPAFAEDCHVDDPTGSALNLRAAPNGKVIGKLRNFDPITIIEYSVDERDNTWARIETRDKARRKGYIFRQFVLCPSDSEG